eukprot:6825794-Pyramimonas_sp.AAC.1
MACWHDSGSSRRNSQVDLRRWNSEQCFGSIELFPSAELKRCRVLCQGSLEEGFIPTSLMTV